MSWVARIGGTSLRAPQGTIPRSVRRVPIFKLKYSSRRFSQQSTEKAFAEDLRHPPVLRPVLFAIGLSGSALGFAAYVTNRDTEKWSHMVKGATSWSVISGPPSSDELRRARHLQLFSSLKIGLDKVKGFFGESPNYVSKVALYTYAMCAQKWANSAEGRRVCRTIIAVNSVIWLAWQIPRLRPLMNRHFMHYPLSGLSHTLLTCVFSHKNFLHLLFNGMALSGFGSTALLYLAMQQNRSPTGLQESTTQYHFVSFFICAGLFSSLLSHVVRARFHFPRLLSQLSTGTATASATSSGAAAASKATAIPTILPSLGASGAIWACVSLSALAFPDARMALVLPTSFAIPIQAGTAGLVALDVLGIIRGWRFFDHWAHLGGAMFGAFYFAYGPRIWDAARLHTRPPQVSPGRLL